MMTPEQLTAYKARERACRKEVPECELQPCGVLEGTHLSWFLLVPGIAVVRGALDAETQRQLITRALTRYPYEYVSNLSKDYRLVHNLWDLHVSKSEERVWQRPQHQRETFLRHAPPCHLHGDGGTGGDGESADGTSTHACCRGGTDHHSVAGLDDGRAVGSSDGAEQVAGCGSRSSDAAALASRDAEAQGRGGPHDAAAHADNTRPSHSPDNQHPHTARTAGAPAKTTAAATPKTKCVAGHKLLPKLRSLNMGYRFNWFSRTYDEEDFAPLPAHLDTLFRQLCALTRPIHGYGTMRPEAVVANYYKHNDRMMGHVDDSEECDTPLLSLSLGADCLFLCGPEAKCARLTTGDLLIMYGPARRYRHSVPRILPLSQPANSMLDGIEAAGVADYIRAAGMRININARQVKLDTRQGGEDGDEVGEEEEAG
ncbi:hypothetical protein PTSG_06918 [Salpingoeca rosetta]|uniref:Fe2OG dioxygenase domain-containing protein n=1 Tax=Salpingoeca rosetta (strain ATCC 50818 / BSB-021) TaxID=946362 RepID=F2UF65_SALR5|nr:uncharacterized protein PTSG_06918 [Salpingoeca rosetta]EGD75265.1 hypothetical protein PTSG_06918 [Salpingoeca rosetta]|eukprot:XP_004992318.1 hypothetical protein PTSG_06918 [Salpingoeca rosetta]